MAARSLIFDPDGDLLLLFQCPAGDGLFDVSPSTPPSPGDGGSPKFNYPHHGNSPLLSPSILSETSTAIEDNLPSFGFSPPMFPRASEETTMRVSSRHLSLASPVFRTMFADGLYEGEELKAGGETTVVVSEEAEADSDGMEVTVWEVLMNVVHGRVRQVPKQVCDFYLGDLQDKKLG